MSQITKSTTDITYNNFTSIQLSFSTADVESSLFEGAEYSSVNIDKPMGEINLIQVDGNVYLLQNASPKDSTPLTENSGIFQIIGLDKQK